MNVINEAKLTLFLQQAVIYTKQEDLKFQIQQHFSHGGDYVLFRHSSLYFFSGGQISLVQATRDRYQQRDYLRFDGERVTRVDPEYYLGNFAENRRYDSEIFGDDDSGGSLGDTLGDTQDGSNNNNNNNNNGNNGNNG